MASKDQLRKRIDRILSEHPYFWHSFSKVLAAVWHEDLLALGADPILLSTEGFLSLVGQEKLTDPLRINQVLTQIQSEINSNLKI